MWGTAAAGDRGATGTYLATLYTGSSCLYLPFSPRHVQAPGGSREPKNLKLQVLDLGCGSGRDCYVTSALVGERGSVIGLDMTPSQLQVLTANSAEI